MGGVHSHLISRVQRDKSRIGCFMSQNEIMMTVFPMFQQHIEPHLVHAHVSTPEILDFTYQCCSLQSFLESITIAYSFFYDYN